MNQERSTCRSIADFAVKVPEVGCPCCGRSWIEDCSQAVAIEKHGKCIVCLVNASEAFDLQAVRGVSRCDTCNRKEIDCGHLSTILHNGVKLVCNDCTEILIAEAVSNGELVLE